MPVMENLLSASQLPRRGMVARVRTDFRAGSRTGISIATPLFCILVILLVSADASPAFAQKMIIWFGSQDGPIISSIKIKSLEGSKGFSKEIKFSETSKQIILTAKDFSRPLEKFLVTVTYSASDVVEFELRMMMPLSDEEREILLVKPKVGYRNVQAAIDELRNIRKGYGSYVTCRQSYFAAPKLNDSMATQVDAAFCWVFANARLVFSDADNGKKLYGMDAAVIEEAEKILTAIDDRNAEQSEGWRKALDESKYSRDLNKVRDEITRLKLAHWTFFADRSELKTIHGERAYCNLMAMFRDELATLLPAQRSRLAQKPFSVSQQAMALLEASAPTQVSTADQSCVGQSL